MAESIIVPKKVYKLSYIQLDTVLEESHYTQNTNNSIFHLTSESNTCLTANAK